MTTTYVPQAGTIAARALAHFVDEVAAGAELANNVLGERLGVDPNILGACLQSPVRHGLLIRFKREGRIYWRRGHVDPAPPPRPPADSADQDDDSDDVAEPIARTVPASAAEPLAGVMRQSWCPVAQPSEEKGSLDEPPASHAKPAAPTPPGLGWVAPTVPAAITRETGSAGVPSVNDETVHALTAAIAPQDPDFREVERTPAMTMVDFTDMLIAGMGTAIGVSPEQLLQPLEPDTPPKGAEAACAPIAPCGRDDATPNNGVVPQHTADGEFACALWTTGELDLVLSDGSSVRLTKPETVRLVSYLERMAETAE